jgi:RNA polymerase sigma-70 factor, ECF subfamily
MDVLPDDIVAPAVNTEAAFAERLDESAYRDDILRLLFTCCHPGLPVEQHITLALRIVSGLTVVEIAPSFLITESAAEQRITRAKRRIADAGLPFETPGPAERAERVTAVAAMIYLLFNEGYSASGGTLHLRLPLCEEAIRLARLLLRMPGVEMRNGIAVAGGAKTAWFKDTEGNTLAISQRL